jgi:hypothetical protein
LAVSLNAEKRNFAFLSTKINTFLGNEKKTLVDLKILLNILLARAMVIS